MNLEDDIDRIPVPKWKALNRTPTSELVSARGFVPNEEAMSSRTERAFALHERWRSNPSLGNALELLDCSLFVEDIGLFSGAASQILSNENTTKTSKLVAQSILSPGAFRKKIMQAEGSGDEIFARISDNKRELRHNMRNALLHVEQARLYTLVGERDAAERSFSKALAIAPNNRHVLRSYSRFMFHAGESEVARRRLLKTAAIKHDPWLQAAEIALAEVASTGSTTAAFASSALNQDRIPVEHRSELASALATLEHAAGNRKRFKKRMGESLLVPTDNALAQAMWFVREADIEMDSIAEVEPWVVLTLRHSREAMTYSYLRSRKWKEAVESFLKWQSEEQFSTHIAVQGSFYSLAFARDHLAAVKLCKNALNANKSSEMLLNNLCVAQRRLRDIAEAQATLDSLKSVDKDWQSKPTFLATDAMMAFARSACNQGRNQYIRALEHCSMRNDKTLRERVKMHWIMEEAVSGSVAFETIIRLISKFEDTTEFRNLSESVKLYWEKMKEEIDQSSYSISYSLPGSNIIEQHI